MDFLNISIDLTFNTSSPTQTVMVPILNDMILEGLEYFSLVLVSNDPAATLNPATANINVLDDIHSTLKTPDLHNLQYAICSMYCNVLVQIVSFPLLVVLIGLNPATYSIGEDAGDVNVTLSVLAGTLDRDVIVTLTTMNSTAMCESLKALKI